MVISYIYMLTQTDLLQMNLSELDQKIIQVIVFLHFNTIIW